MALRILHVVQSLDPAWGGIARVLPELAAGLAKTGLSCRIATLAGGRYGSPPSVPGVEVLSHAASDGGLGRSRRFDRAIGSLLDAADVLHLHGLWTAQNWSAGAAARRRRRPYVMTPHSMMMPWAWQRSWWKKRPIGWLFEHRNLRAAARLHALAAGEAEHIRALGFNERIVTIPNGLWPAEYASPGEPSGLLQRFPQLAGKKWLLFASRIAVQKGIVQLLQAAFDVAGADPAWHLVIAGPDSAGLQKLLAAAAARKGMTDSVSFVGLLDRAELLAVFHRAELFAQPSLSEGLSLSILEAMAAGKPVLISDQCNLPEVKQRDAGRVVPPQRRAIAAALRELVALSPEARREMGARGRALVQERFDWERVLPQYVRLYEELVQA